MPPLVMVMPVTWPLATVAVAVALVTPVPVRVEKGALVRALLKMAVRAMLPRLTAAVPAPAVKPEPTWMPAVMVVSVLPHSPTRTSA